MYLLTSANKGLHTTDVCSLQNLVPRVVYTRCLFYFLSQCLYLSDDSWEIQDTSVYMKWEAIFNWLNIQSSSSRRAPRFCHPHLRTWKGKKTKRMCFLFHWGSSFPCRLWWDQVLFSCNWARYKALRCVSMQSMVCIPNATITEICLFFTSGGAALRCITSYSTQEHRPYSYRKYVLIFSGVASCWWAPWVAGSPTAMGGSLGILC